MRKRALAWLYEGQRLSAEQVAVIYQRSHLAMMHEAPVLILDEGQVAELWQKAMMVRRFQRIQ